MKPIIKKLAALALSMGMLLTACSSGGEGSAPKGDTSTEPVAMGRYIEEELTLPEGASIVESLVRRSDGTLEAIYNTRKGPARVGPWKAANSSDGGKTWTEKTAPFLEQIGACVISTVAYDQEDNLLVRYQEVAQVMLDALDQGKPIDEAMAAEEQGKPYLDLWVDAQGNPKGEPAPAPKSEMGDYPPVGKLLIAGNGDLINGDYFKIYQYSPDGELKNTYEVSAEGSAPDFIVNGNNLLIDVNGTFLTYDLTTGEKTSEEAPKAAAGESGDKNMAFNFGGPSERLMSPGIDGKSVIYSDSAGIYRKVIGGSIEEKIVEGELTSLNMPSFSANTLVPLDDENFVVLFTEDGKFTLMGYTYSKDTPTVPATELKVYSLSDNKTVRQAMGIFQRKNPDVHVNYTVADTGSGSVTTSDLLRTLSTELLAGKGPDVLILDGMPIHSYIAKDILLDLNEVFSGELAGDAYLSNILKAFEQDGKLYAVPARFQVPMILGTEELVNSITDFDTLIQAIEKEKQQNGSQYDYGVLEVDSPEALLFMLYDVCAPSWYAEDGSIKKESLSAFLEGLKRIANPEGYNGEGNPFFYENLMSASSGSMQWAFSHIGLALINMDSVRSLSFPDAAIKKREGKGKMAMLNGQSQQVYLPSSVVGVNKNSKQQELAAEFIRTILSEEVQQNDLQDGIPVNMAAYDKNEQNPYEAYDDGSWIVSTDEDGSQEALQVLWPSEETMAELKAMIQSLDTPSVKDGVIYQTIQEETKEYFHGNRTLEETLNAVMQKVDLYLSE